MQIFLQFIHQVEGFSFTNLRIFVDKKGVCRSTLPNDGYLIVKYYFTSAPRALYLTPFFKMKI